MEARLPFVQVFQAREDGLVWIRVFQASADGGIAYAKWLVLKGKRGKDLWTKKSVEQMGWYPGGGGGT